MEKGGEAIQVNVTGPKRFDKKQFIKKRNILRFVYFFFKTNPYERHVDMMAFYAFLILVVRPR